MMHLLNSTIGLIHLRSTPGWTEGVIFTMLFRFLGENNQDSQYTITQLTFQLLGNISWINLTPILTVNSKN